jgi:hypothetical protein
MSPLMIPIVQAKQRLTAALAKRQTHADEVAAKQADVRRYEQEAAGATAARGLGSIEEASALRRLAEEAEDRLGAAQRILRNARDALAHAVSEVGAAQQAVTQAKMRSHQAHLTDVVARLDAIRTEERRLAFILGAARINGFATTASEAALDSPPPRPTSAVVTPSPGMAADLNTPIGGDTNAMNAAQGYWRTRDAELERDAARQSETANSERAA